MTFSVFLLLTVANIALCQYDEETVLPNFEGIMEKQDIILEKLKDMQQKLEEVENNIEGLHNEVDFIKDAAKIKEASLNNITEKLQILEDFSQERGLDFMNELEEFENKSLIRQQNIHESLQELLGAISLSERDECSDGSHDCGSDSICIDRAFGYACSCHLGYYWTDSGCEEIKCSRPSRRIKGLGCVRMVKEAKTWSEMKEWCEQERGWRLLEDFRQNDIEAISSRFEFSRAWVGVKEERWLKSGLPIGPRLSEGLYRTGDSNRCGYVRWDTYSYEYKVPQVDCSVKHWGFCQLNF